MAIAAAALVCATPVAFISDKNLEIFNLALFTKFALTPHISISRSGGETMGAHVLYFKETGCKKNTRLIESRGQTKTLYQVAAQPDSSFDTV